MTIRGRNIFLADAGELRFGGVTNADPTQADVKVQWTGSVFQAAATSAGTFLRLSKLSLLHQEISDPGNGAAIPATDSGFVNLVTGGAETRTLAIPAAEGLEITINMLTDAGDGVLTVASAVNTAGNNTLTFANIGEVCRLLACDLNGTLAWRIVDNDSVARSTA